VIVKIDIYKERSILNGMANFASKKNKADSQRRQSKIGPRNKGLVEWLVKCPVKGFFVRTEFPDTTDFIKSPFE
jgi:hypothetical protein